MIITLSNTKISASINTIGAELSRLEKNNKNYIWTVDEAFWNKTSPILFPIVGRLKNDSYSINGKSYELPRHGFARNFDFKIENRTENSVIFSLESNAETLQQFPFEFELKMEYRLTENGLEITYLVSNKSNEVMPFSIGAHPAFVIDNAFDNYSLVFNPSEKMIFEGFPYLGIWTKPNAPFLCIEPWCGLADNANHNGNIEEKEGINLLQPQEVFSRTIKIEL